MKRKIPTLKTVFALLICFFAINMAFSQAPTVTINFNPTGLVPGSTIHVPVVMSGTQVGLWSLLIHYNTTSLTYLSTTNTVSSLGFFGATGAFAGTPPFVPAEQLYKASLLYSGGSPGATYTNQTIFTIDFTYNGGDPDLYFKYISTGTSGNNVSYVMANPYTVVNTGTNFINPFLVGSISANQTICYNSVPAPLTGTAPTGGATPYSYQWQTSTDNITFTDISGATLLNYSPGALTSTTYYRQTQTSSDMQGTRTTNVVELTVNAPFVVGSIAASQSICPGNAPSQLTGTAPTGGQLAYGYQWESSPDGITFTPVGGATTLNYQPGILSALTYYRQIQSSAGGCGNLSTNVISISMNPNIVAGQIAANQTICSGSVPALLTATDPTGTSPVYQWQSSLDNIIFANISGATLQNYQPTALTVTTYYRQQQNASGVCAGPVLTNGIAVNVLPHLGVGTIGANQTICTGIAPSLLTATAPSAGTAPTYQWQSSLDNVIYTDISGATTLNYQPGILTATTYYKQIQGASGVCDGPLPTNVVTITVNPNLAVGSISASQSICSGNAPAQLNGVAPSNGTLPVYQWQSSLDNVTFSDISGATLLNYQPGALTTATYYRQSQNASGTCGGPLVTNTLSISLNPDLLVGSISANQTICQGTAPLQLNGIAPSNGTLPTYQWQSSPDNITFTNISGATTINYQPGTLAATTYFRQMQNATGTCLGPLPTNVVTISVTPNLIVGSIGSNQTICTGLVPVQLTGVAPSNGTAPTYQWQNSLDNSTFTDIIGATTINYQPGVLTATTYYRQQQNTTGTCLGPLPTNVVTITVYPNLIIGSISANQTICTGTAPLQLNGIAPSNGTAPTYQWQSSTDNLTFTNISGATMLNYQPGVLSAVTYFRQQQNASETCGGPLFTNVVTISMKDNLIVGSIGINQTICAGIAPAQLTGVAPSNGTAPTYQWQSSLNNVTFTDISGATALDYQPGVLSVTTYFREQQDATGVCGGPLPTNVVTITVTPTLLVGSISANQVICTGSAPLLLAGVAPGNGTSPTYQWLSSTDNVTFTNISGATTLDYQPGVLTTTTYYKQEQNASNTCGGPMFTNVVTITVNPYLIVGSISANQAICTGTAPALLNGVAPTSGTLPYTYQWQSSLDNVTFTNISGATQLNYQPGILSATTYYRQLQSGGCGSPLTTNVVTITVNPPLVVGSIGANQTICSGAIPAQLIGVAPTGGIAPFGYQWQSSPNNVTFTDIVGANSLNYQPGPIIATTYFRQIQSSASGCGGSVTTNVVTITANALPVPTIAGLAAVCAGTTGVTYTTEAGMTGYTWTISAGGTITGGGTTNVITVTWNTAGAQTITVNYSNANNCSAVTPTSKTVTVNPKPVPTITGNAAACAGSTGNVYTTETGMTNYLWVVSAGGTITAGGTTTSNSATVTWTTAGAQTISVNYTNTNGCSGSTATVKNVTVNTLPTPTITGPTSVCQNATGNVYTTQAGMTNYIWTVPAGGTITAGGTSTSNTVTVTWSTTGSKTVTVNYTNTNGCVGTTPGSINITVNSAPVPTIGSNNVPCVNSTGNQYYTEAGMSGYIWSVSAGGVITSGQGTNSILVTWNLPGTQTVSVNYTSASGCPAPNPTVYTLFVNPMPGAAGAITGQGAVCAGTNGVTYSTPAIVNATSYTWSVPTGATIASGAGTTNITVNFSASAVSGNITVTGTNGCGNGTVSTLAVTVNPLPAAAGTITGPASVCQGATGISYTVPTITAATGYVWTVPAGATITSGATSNHIIVSFSATAASGVITVKGTNTCGSGTVSPNFSVTVNPIPPAPVVTVNGFELTSSAPTGNQWYYNGTPIPGATNQTYTVTHNTGYYWVVVTLNGCSSEVSNKEWIEVVGMDELPLSASFNIYPVPNDGLFTAAIQYPVEATFNIVIYNQIGSKIFELRDVKTSGGKFQQLIDLRPISKGLYSVVFYNSEFKIIRKVLVTK